MSRLVQLLTSVVMVLILIGAGVVTYINLSKDDSDSYFVTAFFEKAIGLYENSDVMVLGVPVGKVTNIQPEGLRVRVEMEIEGEHAIPEDATAHIVPISVISDRYVQLSPVYEGGPKMQDGAEIGLDRTQIPAELDDVFAQLKKLLEALEPGQEGEPGALGELIIALEDALAGREADLRGTLSNGARLTRTLSRAGDDISALLINLDNLFEKLATRSGSIGELNRNFALVMSILADSRRDLLEALSNLADMTEEVGALVRDNSDRLGRSLVHVARIAAVVLENRPSVVESLRWLSVVGEGLTNAYHAGHVKAVDVRDNAQARFCEDLDAILDDPGGGLPPLPGPIPPLPGLPELPPELEEVLDQLRDELCPQPGGGGGGGGGGGRTTTPPTFEGDDAPAREELPALKLNCDRGVKKVRRQIERIADMDLPEDVLGDVLRPLGKKLKKLARKCKQIGRALEDPERLEEILDELPEDIDLPDVDPEDPLEDDPLDLEGNAAGAATAGPPTAPEKDGWIDRVLSFVGWS